MPYTLCHRVPVLPFSMSEYAMALHTPLIAGHTTNPAHSSNIPFQGLPRVSLRLDCQEDGKYSTLFGLGDLSHTKFFAVTQTLFIEPPT